MLEEALVRRNQELEEENFVLRDKVAELTDILGSNTSVRGITHLTPKETALVEALPLAPRFITREALSNRLYEHPDDSPESKTLDVYLCKARRSMVRRRAPIWIQTIWGRGYTSHVVGSEFWDQVKTPRRARYYNMTPEEILEDINSAAGSGRLQGSSLPPMIDTAVPLE